MLSAARVAVLGLVAVAGCKTVSSDVAATDAGAGADATVDAAVDAATADADAGPPRVPLHHRATAVTCAPVALPPEPPPSPRDCQKHADCNAKPNGRCVPRAGQGPSFAGGNRCLYDECTTDEACSNNGVCACASDEASLCAATQLNYCNCVDPAVVACIVQSGPEPDASSLTGADCSCAQANVCVTGNCRVDADCGSGGFCSPGRDQCNQFAGWFCHTPADDCVEDADCKTAGEVCHPPSSLLGTTKWQCYHGDSCP